MSDTHKEEDRPFYGRVNGYCNRGPLGDNRPIPRSHRGVSNKGELGRAYIDPRILRANPEKRQQP